MKLALISVLCAGSALAQFDLKGIVDLHVHCNPDSAPPRRTDIFEIGNLFKKEGIRAYVIKSHFLPTAQLAYAMNKVPTSLMKAGITVPEINIVAKRNPARLIGLE